MTLATDPGTPHPETTLPPLPREERERTVMTYGSLFTGIMGLDLGLESCGVGPALWACESDPYARAVIQHHRPGLRIYNDVRDIDERAARPDIICGGFPCQPVSVAGKRKAQKDTRWLWPFFAGVVARLRPSVVFIENVHGLRSAGLRDVLADLAALGFDAEWGCFSACETGAPHTRLRLFILAHSDREPRPAWVRARPEHAGSQSLPSWDHREMPEAIRLVSDADAQRVADGLPREAHRLRLAGNACPPAQAALAWRALTARLPSAPREGQEGLEPAAPPSTPPPVPTEAATKEPRP